MKNDGDITIFNLLLNLLLLNIENYIYLIRLYLLKKGVSVNDAIK
jgi:hypothetical protein